MYTYMNLCVAQVDHDTKIKCFKNRLENIFLKNETDANIKILLNRAFMYLTYLFIHVLREKCKWGKRKTLKMIIL